MLFGPAFTQRINLFACGGRLLCYMGCKGSCFVELLYCVFNFNDAYTLCSNMTKHIPTWCVHIYLIVNLFGTALLCHGFRPALNTCY